MAQSLSVMHTSVRQTNAVGKATRPMQYYDLQQPLAKMFMFLQ